MALFNKLVYFEFIISAITVIFLWTHNRDRGLHTASYYMSQDAKQTLIFTTVLFCLLLSRLSTIFLSWHKYTANYAYLLFTLLQFYTLFSLTSVTMCFDVDIHNNLSATTMLFALLVEISSIFLNVYGLKYLQIMLVLIFAGLFIYFLHTVLTLERNTTNYVCELDNFLIDPEFYVPGFEIGIYVLITILPLFRLYWKH